MDLQDSNSKITNILKQMDNGLPKATFGLDEGSPDDKKMLDHIRKQFDTAISSFEKANDDQNSKLDELDKHLNDIAGYKGPA